MPAQYQLMFTGQLLKGRDPVRVCQALASHLKLPLSQISDWCRDPGQHLLADSMSLDEAQQLRLQLAKIGAVTVIADQAVAEKIPPATARPHGHSWPWLRRFSPLRPRWLVGPAILMGALISLLLVLVHAALVALLLWGVWLPSVSTSWAGNMLGNPLLGMAVQLGAIVVSSLALLLLLKPLLSIRWPRYRGVLLNPGQEADLHGFIEDVSERIGVRPPDSVYLEYTPRLEVHYHYGLLGWVRHRRVLRLGMPLVAGLDCSQLAAALAVAMNRFHPRYLPLASSLILALQAWLQTALHQPDWIDRVLSAWYGQGRIGKGFYRQIQRFVAISRVPLWIWLFVSQMFSYKAMHRLFADADDLAVKLGGSEGFLRLTGQSLLLQHSNRESVQNLAQQWRSTQTLPADLIQGMVLRSRQYPSDMVQQLRSRQQDEQAQDAQLLPADMQRLQRLKLQAVTPAYACLSPAAILFSHYAKLGAAMTLRYYHHRLHLPVSRHHLQQDVPEHSLEAGIGQAYQALFAGLYQDYAVLDLKSRVSQCLRAGGSDALWGEAEQRCRAGEKKARLALLAWQDSRGVMIDAQTREEIHLAGLWRVWGESRLSGSEMEALHQWTREAEQGHENAVQAQHEALQAYADRLAASLVAGLIPRPEAEREAMSLLDTLTRIEQVAVALRELNGQSMLLEILLSYANVGGNGRLKSRIEQRSSDIARLLTSIGLSLKNAVYPFRDSKCRRLMDYLLLESLPGEEPQAVLDRAQDVLIRLPRVQGRVMLRLEELARRAER